VHPRQAIGHGQRQTHLSLDNAFRAPLGSDCLGQENRTNVVIFDSAEMDAKLLNAAIYFMYSGDCEFPHAMHFDL
jgi:hypothetical protein